jgi:hypothetical protein
VRDDSGSERPRRPRWAIWILVALVGLLLACGWFRSLPFFLRSPRREETTTTLLSPDERTLALLVELPRFIDRNFDVRLRRRDGPKPVTETIFSSPDEGRPVGSERFIWSLDSEWLLLVGRHFHVKGDCRLTTGEDAYLLHSVSSGTTWTNAAQAAGYEPFGAEKLAGIDFGQPLEMHRPTPAGTSKQSSANDR